MVPPQAMAACTSQLRSELAVARREADGERRCRVEEEEESQQLDRAHTTEIQEEHASALAELRASVTRPPGRLTSQIVFILWIHFSTVAI